MEMTHDELAALLDPWHDVLHSISVQLAGYDYDASTSTSSHGEGGVAVWLVWTDGGDDAVLTTDDWFHRHRLCKAIQLLSTLSWVDPLAWQCVARAVWPGRACPWARLARDCGQEAMRFCGLELALRHNLEVFHGLWSDRSEMESLLSSEYHHVRSVLRGNTAAIRDGCIDSPIPTRIRFLPFVDAGLTWRSSDLISEILAAPLPEVPPPEGMPNLILWNLNCILEQVDLVDTTPMDEHDLYGLVEIQSRGIQLVTMGELGGITVTTKNAVRITRAFQSLLATRSTDSGSLRECQLNYVDPSAALLVGASLLNQCCTNDIQRLTLGTIELTDTLLTILRGAALAPDPLVVGYPEYSEQITFNRDTRIAASKILLFDPSTVTSIDEDQAILDDQEHNELRVLGKQTQWWSVLLPGWGQAWVHVDDAQISSTSVRLDQVTQTASTIRYIPQLVLTAMDSMTLASLRSILNLLGPGIKELRLQAEYARSKTIDSWCPIVFRACPMLRRFSIHSNELVSVPLLIDAIVSSRCQLQCLELVAKEAMSTNDWVLLFRTLADDTHMMTKHLESFCLEPSEHVATRPDRLQWVIDMLETNTRLIDFRLCVTMESPCAAEVFEKAFAKYHGTLVAVEAQPLSIRQKCAFLGVGDWLARSSQVVLVPVGHLFKRLDAPVLSTIFQFAAPCRFRSVDVVIQDY